LPGIRAADPRARRIEIQVLASGGPAHRIQRTAVAGTSRTRLVSLDAVTRRDAASSFFGEDNVPAQALTMGVGTILEAKKSSSWPLASTRPALAKSRGKPGNGVGHRQFRSGSFGRRVILDESAAKT